MMTLQKNTINQQFSQFNRSEMRILISLNDQTGTPRTTRISILNCTNTTQFICQIASSLQINKNAFVFCLKNQIVNLRILQNWPLHIYNIKNGSWVILQQNQLFYNKEPSLSSTSSLQKIQENSGDFQGSESLIQHSYCSSDKKMSFGSKLSEKDYSEYFDQELSKMLNFVRNNKLSLVASLLKQEPDIADQTERQMLLESKNKYVLNELGQCGRNALHWSIHNQNVQILSFLLMKYADPSILTLDQYTALQLAVIYRNVQIVKILLLQPKVDCNRITVYGSALHLAVYHCSPMLVKLLLQNGAKPEQKNNEQKMAIELTELKQIKKIFQDFQIKNQLRLLRPNITKGNVLKVSSMTFRGKQRTLMSNPFKGDLIFYKQNQIVDHKIKINSILKVEKLNEKSWLMDQKIKYMKITYEVDGDDNKIIIGLKNQAIFTKWISNIETGLTYVKNIEFVQKLQSQMQLIEILDDNKNEIKVHKRQVQTRKIQSPTKYRFSLYDMKISNQTQNDDINKNIPKTFDFLPSSQEDLDMKSFISNEQGGQLRYSQILIGSIINESTFDSPPNRISINLKQNSANFVTVPFQNNKFFVAERISSAPNFRKQSAEFSKISQFNFEETKEEKKDKKKISFNNFEFKNLLGSGAFGQVYLAKHKINGKLFAMKVLNKKKLMAKKHLKYAISETNILKRISHPFIVELHHSFQTPNNLYLCLDYCSNGDLSEALSQKQKFSEITAKFIIVQIILAIQYLHNQKIIYRDLKPENILIADDGYIKLIDFGLSKQNNFATSFCGSPAYLSPEMLQKKGHSFPTDIYGLGCILYEMVIGEPPFFDEKIDQLFENIKNGRLKFPGYLSKQIKSLISRMLQKDSSKRVGSKGFQQVKQHQFFKGVNWEKILDKKMSAPKDIFPETVQEDYFKLQNKINQVLQYIDQQYTQNTLINRIKGFTFSRED